MADRIAVIGAGVGGMSAAYDLIKAGHSLVIYEADRQVGGLVQGFKEPGWDWTVEKFYHHWFASDRHMLGLINELGWSDQVLFPRPFTVMYYNGRFFPFDSITKAMIFVEGFNSPWFQVYPDVGNLGEHGLDVLAELDRGRGHLVGIHVKDTRPGEPRRVPFGQGIVPFVDAFRKLAELRYAGP
ncbi:MAG: NAD(P)-binding protein, partial [Anaerolineales bacterium]|nr:NAD(P)-binding protein [Anaerolineales bacterium]